MQRQQPIHAALDRLLPAGIFIRRKGSGGEGDYYLGGVVNVGVMYVFKLEGPAAGFGILRPYLPISRLQDLAVQQPPGGLLDHRIRGGYSRFHQGYLSQTGVPNGGDTGLHDERFIVFNGEIFKPGKSLPHHRMVHVEAQLVQGNEAVDPGRLDASPGPVPLLVLLEPIDDFALGVGP